MNWIICPTRNNVMLLKHAVRSFRAQDIGDIGIVIFDNGSTDGTTSWLHTQHDLFSVHAPGYGLSVSQSWNRGLQFVFERNEDYALVVNNDVELRPDTYRWLVNDGGLFVTAVGVREPERIATWTVRTDRVPIPVDHYRCMACGRTELDGRLLIGHDCPAPPPGLKSPHPDFSCYLIRREAWDRVGPFDENFKVAFCEDWDYHVRLQKAGIRAEALALPYLHHASQTVKNATNEDRDRIQAQAERNREYFFQKWGVRGGTPEYDALFDHAAPLPEKGQTTSPLNHKTGEQTHDPQRP